MEEPRAASVKPTEPAHTVLAGLALALLAALAPAAFAGKPVGPAAGQPTQGRPLETSVATWDRQLVLPPPVVARLDWAQRSLAPSGLQKLQRLARSLAPQIASEADPAGVQSEALRGLNAVFSAAGLSNIDLSEAAFLVMAMATKDMDDDLRLIMAEVKATSAAKQKLRDQINELEDWIRQEMAKRGQASANLDRERAGAARAVAPGGATLQPTAPAHRSVRLERATSPLLRWEYTRAPVIARLPPRGSTVTVESLRSLQADLSGTLESTNELSEAVALRITMTMERRAKFIQTLSNILKKTTTTTESLVQNLK
jgi:hypothetical protein